MRADARHSKRMFDIEHREASHGIGPARPGATDMQWTQDVGRVRKTTFARVLPRGVFAVRAGRVRESRRSFWTCT